MEAQDEFLFAHGAVAELHLPDPLAGFFQEVATLWELPIGERVHVALREHHFSDLEGRLELSRAPDLPLNRRESLALRIGAIEFSSRQIMAWSVA